MKVEMATGMAREEKTSEGGDRSSAVEKKNRCVIFVILNSPVICMNIKARSPFIRHFKISMAIKL